MKVNIIAAMSRYNVIGFNNTLPWHIPEDFKHFKETTNGAAVIMGRNTWESLPKKPLPKRTNIVVCDPAKGEPTHGFNLLSKTLSNALAIAEGMGYFNAFIIGGAKLYEEGLKLADELIITRIDASYEGDVYFPEIKLSEWGLETQKPLTDKAAVSYYKRLYS